MNEIQKFDKQPKRAQIVGAPDIDAQGRPQILDRRTRQEPTPAEIRVHEETVTEDDRLRRSKPGPGEPRIRIRNFDLKDWEKVKRGDD